MQYDPERSPFDLSDVSSGSPRDSTRDIINLAVEVLDNYGDEDATRISRLAKWIVHNAAATVEEVCAGGISKIDVAAFTVWRVGSKVGLGYRDTFAAEPGVKHLEYAQVRELVSALLVVLDLAESDAE